MSRLLIDAPFFPTETLVDMAFDRPDAGTFLADIEGLPGGLVLNPGNVRNEGEKEAWYGGWLVGIAVGVGGTLLAQWGLRKFKERV